MSYDKRELFRIRGGFCECGCGQFAHDVHHCFIPDLKRFALYVNDERNVVLVNHHEHVAEKKFDNVKWRRYFWQRQIDRYGYDAMQDWLDGLPAKMNNRKKFL